MKKYLIPAAFTILLLLSGCINVTNTRIKVTRFEGNCMPPTHTFPCCDSFPERHAEIIIDNGKLITDYNGEINLNLEPGNHTITYHDCSGKLKNLSVEIKNNTLYYNKTVVYNNGQYETIEVMQKKGIKGYLIEINLPCCTA